MSVKDLERCGLLYLPTSLPPLQLVSSNMPSTFFHLSDFQWHSLLTSKLLQLSRCLLGNNKSCWDGPRIQVSKARFPVVKESTLKINDTLFLMLANKTAQESQRAEQSRAWRKLVKLSPVPFCSLSMGRERHPSQRQKWSFLLDKRSLVWLTCSTEVNLSEDLLTTNATSSPNF